MMYLDLQLLAVAVVVDRRGEVCELSSGIGVLKEDELIRGSRNMVRTGYCLGPGNRLPGSNC